MKKKNGNNASLSQRSALVRKNRVAVMLNDEEIKALNRFINTYKIKNKSRFVRETLMTAILKKFDEDHPTLF
jgi:metal-responsive CopG/Arc/MetJ family transcriptional regulator